MDVSPAREEYDAIIVGSGPSGATVARELARKKKRVLILERGGDAPPKGGFRGTASILQRVPLGKGLAAASALTAGGSTAVYFGVAHPPPLEVFRSLGIDLSREAEEVTRELPQAILPDELLGPQALRVRESATALGHAWKKNTMLIDPAKCASGYARTAKWTARAYLEDAAAAGATIVYFARALKVLVDQRRAVGIEYRARTGRRKFEVRRAFGRSCVLSAGATASPLLLRESGVRDVAGHGFYCHPSFAVFGLVNELEARDNFVGSMGVEVDEGLALGDGNCDRVLYRMLMLTYGRVWRAFRYSRSIAVGVTVRERLGGALQDDGRFYKELTTGDLGKLEKGAELAREIIRNAGGKHLFRTPTSAAHVGGTVNIGEHLDPDLQTEIRDLHVCDGSVVPETAKGPPVVTLICLGKYLASRLLRAR